MRPNRQDLRSLTRSVGRPFRSIRSKLLIALAVVVGVGLVNVAVSYWGGERRAATFEQLSLAIQRQSLLTEVHNTLEEQRRIVALTAAGSGTPLRTERAQFAAELAAVPERFAALVALSDGQEREAAYAMETAARALADRWTTFYVGSAHG